MKFSQFLRSKSVPICCIAISMILWSIFAIFATIEWIFIALTALTIFLTVSAWLIWEYSSFRKRLKYLERLQKEIEEGYLLGEVLPAPDSTVEKAYFSVMKFVSRSAIGKLETLLREQTEYKDYVERWIHEIKTPLTACSLILENGGDKRKLKAELKRAENLTETVLYHARMRTLALDTQIAEVDLRKAVEEAIVSEMELLLAAGIGVDVEGQLTAYTDKKAIVFMLKQLLVNCAKYCPEAHVNVTMRNGIMCLEDDGPGISSHELPRIFARGFVGSVGRMRGGSTGMGLYLVHELCKQLEIGLEVQSKEGEFTRFIFRFQLTKM